MLITCTYTYKHILYLCNVVIEVHNRVVGYITTMQCIYALTFYLSFETFSKGLKHLIKYCSFANLAEMFSDFSLKKRKHYKFGVGFTARVQMCTHIYIYIYIYI